MRASLHRAGARLREVFGRERLRRERDEELRFHLEAETEQNLARGMAPEEARRAALLAFGGLARFREEIDEARGFVALEALGREVRLAARRLARAPAFSAGIVGTLAIGLGAATGIGTLVYAVLLRPLPYPEPDRLLQIALRTPGLNLVTEEHSAGTFAYLRDEARSLAAIGGYSLNEGVTLTDGGEPERVVGAAVTPGLLDLLGVRPLAGRLFTAEDARADTTGVVISAAL